MAAQQIPSGNQGSRGAPRGIGRPALRMLFDRDWFPGRKSPAKRGDLRRNEPVGVQFSFATPDRTRSRGLNPAAPRHVPVLGREAIEMLSPRDGGIYVDAPLGAGGYSRQILDVPG